jgi:hypothetical protein
LFDVEMCIKNQFDFFFTQNIIQNFEMFGHLLKEEKSPATELQAGFIIRKISCWNIYCFETKKRLKILFAL